MKRLKTKKQWCNKRLDTCFALLLDDHANDDDEDGDDDKEDISGGDFGTNVRWW